MNYKTEEHNQFSVKVNLLPKGYVLKILLAALIGAAIFSVIGYFSETNVIAIPRLEPLSGSPFGTVTFFFAIFSTGLSGMITGLVTLKPIAPTEHIRSRRVAKQNKPMLRRLLMLRLPAWLTAVVIAAITATSYIWILSAAYGPSANQDSRIGYTLKNVQRIPGDTPQIAATSIAQMYTNAQLEAPYRKTPAHKYSTSAG